MIHVIFGLLFLSFSDGEYFEGFVKQNNRGFGFAARFCFDVNFDHHQISNPVGNIAVTLRSPKAVENMWVGLFDDQDNSWKEVYENQALTCEQVKMRAKNYYDGDIESKWRVFWEGIESDYDWSESSPIAQNIRPRWWYVAVGSCENKFNPIEYDIHMEQLQRSNWNKEFGTNEMGLNTLYLVFFFYYLIFFIIHCVGTCRLRKKLEYTHPLVRFFFFILLLQFVVVITRMLHYGIFANNGWGVPGLNQFSEIAEIFTRIGFLVVLMLLAKGWTISNKDLAGKKWILGFAFLFLVAEVGVILWKWAIENPAETNISLGFRFMLYLVMSIWFLWCIWFGITVLISYQKETNPPKKRLYLLLAVIYIPWLFGLPFLTLLQFALNPWVRFKVIAIVSLLISTFGFTFLSFLLWPTRAEEYFAITGPDTMANSGISNYEQL